MESLFLGVVAKARAMLTSVVSGVAAQARATLTVVANHLGIAPAAVIG